MKIQAHLVAETFRWALSASGYTVPDAADREVGDFVDGLLEITYPLVGRYSVVQPVVIFASDLERFVLALERVHDGIGEDAQLGDADGCMRLHISRGRDTDGSFEVQGEITAGYGVRLSFDQVFIDRTGVGGFLAEARAMHRRFGPRYEPFRGP